MDGHTICKEGFQGKVYENVFLKKAGIFAHLNHPHIVKFFCYGIEQGSVARCFIAMELMEMSLTKLISLQLGKNI